MKRMSKILCIALSVILVFGFAATIIACKKTTEETVKITFLYDDGDEKFIEVKKGELIPQEKLPTDPRPNEENEIFKFWSDDGTRDFVSTQSPDKDIELSPVYRQRNPNEYIVLFDTEGGTHIKTQSITGGGKATKPSDPERDRSTFEKWRDTELGDFNFENTVINKDHFLIALWKTGDGQMLVQGSASFDTVFSPFFATSAADSTVISDTQISMLSSNSAGKPYVGEDVPSVAKDFNYTTYIDDEPNPTENEIGNAVDGNFNIKRFYTEYQFVIKNGIKFSDGTDLTIKDVLFNMYLYLDPVYSGSSTMYSTKIEGLQAYRTQDPNASDAVDAGDSAFIGYANNRMINLRAYFNMSNTNTFEKTRADFAVENYEDDKVTKEGRNKEVVAVEDAYRLREMFWKELTSDAAAAWRVDDVARDYAEYGFKAGEYWKVFLLNVGLITVKRDSSTGEILKWDGNTPVNGPKKEGDPWVEFVGESQKYEKWGREDLVKIVFNSKMGILKDSEIGNYDSLDKSKGSPQVDFEFENGNIKGSKYPLGDPATWDKNNTNSFYGRIRNTSISKNLHDNLGEISRSWGSASELMNYMISNEKSIRFLGGSKRAVSKISGITVGKVGPGQPDNKEFVNQDGTVRKYTEDHYVLKVKIGGVDPKAIWNFGFQVSPMHYYSHPDGKSMQDNKGELYTDAKHGYKAFVYPGVDGEEEDSENVHPGFAQFDGEYFEKVFRHASVLGVPVGAGAFKATNVNGTNAGLGVIKPEEFCINKVQVNLRRNDYFNTTGAAMNNVQFEHLRYMVVDSSKILETLKSAQGIDVGEPYAKYQNVMELNNAQSTLGYNRIQNNGYGYVGVNAAFVPDIEIRQAIMTALDPSYIVEYYSEDLCELLDRPMSNHSASWAYPDNPTPRYVYNSKTIEKDIRDLVAAAKFTGATLYDGAYTRTEKGEQRNLKFTFTIAGSSADHPAYQMFLKAKAVLEKCGFKITVKTDAFALSALASGGLAVWAAAWSSTIDPDMYQVYHKKSRASSTSNWGYRYLLDQGNGSKDELEIIDNLSTVIDEARQTTNQSIRKGKYAEALDYVMDLAVEYPTYQRYNLIAYDKTKIDVKSLVPSHLHSPYYGPFSTIWKIRLLK